MEVGRVQAARGVGVPEYPAVRSCPALYGLSFRGCFTLEAGLDRFVRLDKGDFKEGGLIQAKQEGIQRRLVGLERGSGIARHGCQVKADDRPIGQVTSGVFPDPKEEFGSGTGGKPVC